MRVFLAAVCIAVAASTSLAAVAGPQPSTHEPNAVGRDVASNPEKAAEIFAADLGSIRSWKPDGKDAMLVESIRGDWYRATFWGPCDDLRYSDNIGFVTSPSGNLDRFSSVVVGRQECTFKSFVKIEASTAASRSTTSTPAQPTGVVRGR